MLHFIRFFSGGGKPTILFRSAEGLGGHELEAGKRHRLAFSDKRACVGFRSPSSLAPCPNHAVNVKQCPACALLDISKAYTVGDFTGHPELYEKAKEEEYCLYLAGFGEDIIKCGVTRAERFEERMREQGADFGCMIASQKGPDGIYGAEAAIQARFNFANSVRMEQKMRRLDFDANLARENFKAAVEMVRGSGCLPDFSPKILELSAFYPRASCPQRAGFVDGKILGAKGEILLFEAEGGRQMAANMRQMIGLFFEPKEPYL
ncbi:MAG: DUF2797 domain-containing protein [Candidatus Micrarchaeota archaeon]|nr:DUF2797 domain-containing protein [Candidatus Micrarchaeota archaeon]